MKRILINATQPDEIRVAQVDHGRLIDFDIERTGKESTKGNIYKGRVTAVKADLEAAFVDYGAERHGLLSMRKLVPTDYFDGGREQPKDPLRIEDVLKVNQELLVQVEKEPYGHKKGAALTTDFSLVGRFTVLKPKNPDGGISLQITGNALEDMKKVLSSLDIPEGMGMILRTASEGKSRKEIQEDLDIVLRAWADIVSEREQANAPQLVFQENGLIRRIVRDKLRDDIEELIVDNADVFNELSSYIRNFMPGLEGRINLHEDSQPLFSKFRIEADISRAFEREVALPSGGRITIDPTEALVSIDVNSARAKSANSLAETALNTNREAVAEIARQLRLRDIGGLIVVDFIDMDDSGDRAAIEGSMEETLSEDRANTSVTSISRFGLMEIQRQRLRPPLHDTSFESCPRCSGSGRIRDVRSTSLSALRDIEAAAGAQGLSSVQANAPLDVATYLLNEKRSEVLGIEERTQTRVMVVPDSRLQTPSYQVQQIGFGDTRFTSDTPSFARQLDSEFNSRPNGRSKRYEGERTKPETQVPLVKNVHQTQYPSASESAGAKPERKRSERAGAASQPGIWNRIFSALFGGAAASQTKQPHQRQARTGRAHARPEASEPSTGRRNAPVILPNGDKRADYIRRRFHEEDASRGQIIREINEMNQAEYGAKYKRVNPSVVYQATRGPQKNTNDASQKAEDSTEPRRDRKTGQRQPRQRSDDASGQPSSTDGAALAGAGNNRRGPDRRSRVREDRQKQDVQGQDADRNPRRGRRNGHRQPQWQRNGSDGGARTDANHDERTRASQIDPLNGPHGEPSVAELFLQLDEAETGGDAAARGAGTTSSQPNEFHVPGSTGGDFDEVQDAAASEHRTRSNVDEEIYHSDDGGPRAKNDPRAGELSELSEPRQMEVFAEPEDHAGMNSSDHSDLRSADVLDEEMEEGNRAHNDPRKQP